MTAPALDRLPPRGRPTEYRYDGLTQRLYTVACLVADGHSSKRIAAMLGITKQAVDLNVSRIADLWALDPQLSYRVQITRRIVAPKPASDPLQIALLRP